MRAPNCSASKIHPSASIALIGHVGAVKSPTAPTKSPRVQDRVIIGQCAYRMTAITAIPVRSNNVSRPLASDGNRACRISITPSLRVMRPALSACGACRKTIATMERETISGTPDIGAPKRLRPSTSDAISATNPRISNDPTKLLICVSQSRAVKRRDCGAPPAWSVAITLYPNRAAVWLRRPASTACRAGEFQCPACFLRPDLRPIPARHWPSPQPTLCASRQTHR